VKLSVDKFCDRILTKLIMVHGICPPTVCQSPKFLVISICSLPDVINCQFRECATALLGTVHFLSPDQQSGTHYLIICAIQLLTPNNLGGIWRRICSPDIWNVSALEVFHNRILQIDIYFTLLLLYMLPAPLCSVGDFNALGIFWTHWGRNAQSLCL